MSTLTLKKRRSSDPAAPKPVNDLIGKFAVMRHSRTAKSLRFTAVHPCKEDADREAARLLVKLPTERFLVVEVLSGVEDAAYP